MGVLLMSDTSQDVTSKEFLKKLEQRSLKQQEAFMDNIAHRLGREQMRTKPKHPYQGAPEFWKEYGLSLEERIALFMDNWKQSGGEAQHFEHIDDAKQFIVQTAEELKAKYMIRQNQNELNALDVEKELPSVHFTVWDGMEDRELLLSSAARSDIGLVVADAAVAHTGSLVVMSDQDKGRTVSLLPTALMVLIPAERLKTRMGEVMLDIRHIQGNSDGSRQSRREGSNQIKNNNLPAGIHFISGPSRSADIENDLTIGVHGPGVVYALIVE